MDPALLCKCFFTLGAATSIAGTLIPSFRRQVMNYGPRATPTAPRAEDAAEHPKTTLVGILDRIAYFQVPHTWFIHYYIVSVLSSIFWALQILAHGKVFNFLAFYHQPSNAGGMTVNQLFLAWTFMAFQGSRRLYECITLTKSSQSKMWVGVWLLGMAYYIFMGVSIWIEASRKWSLYDSWPLIDSISYIEHH